MDSLTRRIHPGAVSWPPDSVAEHWDNVAEWQRRFDNDRDKLLMYNETFSGSYDQAQIYTPVPLSTEIARLSAALMFSASPTITHPSEQAALDEFMLVNGVDPFFQSTAENISIEGRGAFRVLWDEDISSDVPVISHVHENQILWEAKHKRFVISGTVVIERDGGEINGKVYRLLEKHGIGYVERKVYRGDSTRLGTELPYDDPEVREFFPDYEGVEPYEETGLDVPTLIRWDNVPGGRSDIQGLELYLDRLDEAESLLLDKGRKSVPITLADEGMIDDGRSFVAPGVTFVKATGLLPEDGSPFVETIEPAFDVEPHLAWIRHIRESILMYGGFSLASWGFDSMATFSSGKELKLRQARTLLTKAGKDRMAIEAIRTAFGTALALQLKASDIRELKPDVELGDGLPEDAIENAQQIQLEDSAGAVSLEEKVRIIRPDWTNDQILAEVQAIEQDKRKALMLEALQNPTNFAPAGGAAGSPRARGVSGDSTSGPARKDQQ